jgi:sodium/hydrogen antiporter
MHQVFIYTTLAITLSVLIHGVTATPFSTWLSRKTPTRATS